MQFASSPFESWCTVELLHFLGFCATNVYMHTNISNYKTNERDFVHTSTGLQDTVEGINSHFNKQRKTCEESIGESNTFKLTCNPA